MGDFLGGTHSVRPQIRAGLKPGHSIPTGWVHGEPVAKRTHASVKPVPSSGRAEPGPPGGRAKVRWPCGGRPGDRAMGDFLGGTRSARPRIRAGCKPGYGMITEK